MISDKEALFYIAIFFVMYFLLSYLPGFDILMQIIIFGYIMGQGTKLFLGIFLDINDKLDKE
jgi:hypothetical protein